MSKFGHLAGKSVARNTIAQQEIKDWGQSWDSPVVISDCDIIQRKVFDFGRLQSNLDDTIERIHVLDTIDTLDLDRFVTAIKSVLAVKQEIRVAFGTEFWHGTQELNNVTGYNFA